MDYKNAEEAFEKYLDNFDKEDSKTNLKIVHTYGVVKCAEEITKRMGLKRKDIEIAKIIALLHDIGRFEQIKQFNSFEPKTMNHAAYGVELLFTQGKIREFVSDNIYDDVIRESIAHHSDYKLTDNLSSNILFHAKLVRDADKIDNCRVKLEESFECLLDVTVDVVAEAKISTSVKEACLKGQWIKCSNRMTPMDYWVSYIAYLFDINFQESKDIIRENDYVSRLVGRIPYKDPDTKHTMEEIRDLLKIKCAL